MIVASNTIEKCVVRFVNFGSRQIQRMFMFITAKSCADLVEL